MLTDQDMNRLHRQVKEHPNLSLVHHDLGAGYTDRREWANAEVAFRKAIQLDPACAPAHYGLGNVLRERLQLGPASVAFRKACALRPNYYEALNNLGAVLMESRKTEEASVVLRQALRLHPESAQPHNNLATCLVELGRFAEAQELYHKALSIAPDYAECHLNLGNAYREQGRIPEALEEYEIALWLKPDHPGVRSARGTALLKAGNYVAGWEEHEWRWKTPAARPLTFDKPLWDGSPLNGRTLLVTTEQGFGDILQFVRFVPKVEGRVILSGPKVLVPILSTCAAEVLSTKDSLPPFDVHCPLMSLPHRLGITLENIPAEPYLQAEARRVEEWKTMLAEFPGLKVGISWKGNPLYQWDRFRSASERDIGILHMPGVSLLNLQKAQENPNGVFTVLSELDSGEAAFLDTAAIMKSLDLVITVDTAIGHLAGALGIPCWIALSAVSDWRWGLDREDTPWYPSVRLFRQKTLGDWEPVFARMASELSRLAHRRGIPIEISPGELIDRMTILEIKAKRFKDAEKRSQARQELAALRQVRAQSVQESGELANLESVLHEVNTNLWQAENAVRAYPASLRAYQEIPLLNDRRAALKRQINELLGSAMREQKEYA
jgi:Tfp pilus assembly protein PilF